MGKVMSIADERKPVSEEKWRAWTELKASLFGYDYSARAIIWSVQPDQVMVRMNVRNQAVFLGDPVGEFPSEDLRRRMMILL